MWFDENTHIPSELESSSVPKEESLQLEFQQNNNNENEVAEGEGFFTLYLLASLSPRFKGNIYIGLLSNLLKI